jgi:uncharacterized membrane protein YdjX (TVP38/TMEM64 family)
MSESPPLSRPELALRALPPLALAALAVVLYLTGSAPSSDDLHDWGEDLGWSAVVVWPVLFAAVNFVVPWPLLAGASGLVFGTAGGTALALLGVLLASVVQMLFARYVAGVRLRERIHGRAPRIDHALATDGLLAVFYSRLVPGIPWGLVNALAGLARVRARDLLLATLLGGTPKVFAYVALGGSLDDLSSPEARVAIALWVALGLGGLVFARRRLAEMNR